MKNKILLIILMFASSLSWSQGLKTQGKVIVNSQGEEVILRGLGPGGWQIMEGYMMNTSGVAGSQHEIKEKLIDLMGKTNTETFFSKWRTNHFTKRDVDSLAAWGFNSIRIPMHYNLFTLPIEEEPIAGENTWIETGFDLIDDVLAWAEPHNIYVILDMHATPGGQGRGSEINDYDPSKPSLWESQENKDKLVALWTRIADRYKDNEWIGGYDLINETHWDLPGGTALRQLYENITTGIRTVDTKHILFIEGNSYANDHNGLTPPWDPNIVYSFHKYWNTNNANDLDWILPLREEHNVPLWMGESGENSNTWFTDAVKLFEDNGIGWAWWTMRKIGDIDSPYAVDINPGYQKILDYWKGEGSKPTEQETFDGMMQLAENLLVENSKFRKDVPDALIRQVQTDETKPYNTTAFEIPGVVYMADFDLGKNNFAYYDNDVADYNLSTGEFQAWNRGWSYRNDGVDIEKNNDIINSNGYHVGFVEKGEWLKYTIQVNETGAYKAQVRLATQENGGKFHITIDGEAITTTQTVNSTGGWTDFEMHEITDVLLTEGPHALKLYFDNDTAFNISSIEFTKTGEIETVPFMMLNGETGEDEKSVKIVLNESILGGSINEFLDNFSLTVNGISESITALSIDENFDKTIILTLEEPLIYTDKILVSYTGTEIKSQTDKTLETFSDLEIRNTLSFRFKIPGKIEVEDFDVMVGLSTEDTSDDGGGKNIGYTDTGDYADYLIFIEEEGNYKASFRFASEWGVGKIGLSIIDENLTETELGTISTPITGGWQTWQTKTSNMLMPKGIYTLRMRIIDGNFNMNWMEFEVDNVVNPDTDNDGVVNENDQCPNTTEGVKVNVHGCEVFSLPISNFGLRLFSETCKSSNNGSISITAKEDYNYTATLTGSINETKTFNSQTSFQNLEAGAYVLCISVEGKSDYEQCFNLVVNEPQDLTVQSKINKTASKVTLSLKGSDSYLITFNEEFIRTSESEITLDLAQSKNTISVKTNNDCQGVYKETILMGNTPLVYPNPVQNNKLFINAGNIDDSSVEIQLFNVAGNLISSNIYASKNGVIEIDVTTIPRGIFIVKMATSKEIFNYKIIRQ